MITEDQAKQSLDLLISAQMYPKHTVEDLQIGFNGNLSDPSTLLYAALNITAKFAKLIEDHEMIIRELQKSIDTRNSLRAGKREPVSSGQAYDALQTWTSELPHIILLRDYLLQRLEKRISNE
ncbi:hypothetical protein PHYNN_102 [Pantoea phage Phynn]|nr:hypothetical protein PHYNN_102 [Pantoea phage Phynn]